MRTFTSWQDLAQEYLDHRQTFGNDLTRQGHNLKWFAKHLDEIGFKGPLTNEVQINWVRNQQGKTSDNRARKINTIRKFARYLSLFDEKTEIPPMKMFGDLKRRFVPHIYSDAEIELIFKKLKEMFNDKDSFSAVTYQYAFALILSTGLRASEAANLFCEDVDLEKGILRVVEGKFKKSRLLPIDASVVTALKEYKKLRDEAFPRCRTSVFFVLAKNIPMTYGGMQSIFYETKTELGFNGYMKRRIHDLRHTFVVNRLISWHRSGEDSEKKLAALSVYLGHAKLSDTYWYFTLTPELQDLVSKRFEDFSAPAEVSV